LKSTDAINAPLFISPSTSNHLEIIINKAERSRERIVKLDRLAVKGWSLGQKLPIEARSSFLTSTRRYLFASSKNRRDSDGEPFSDSSFLSLEPKTRTLVFIVSGMPGSMPHLRVCMCLSISCLFRSVKLFLGFCLRKSRLGSKFQNKIIFH
jgi:hypothetical protein